MNSRIQEYFTFSKKERIGVIVLVVIILLLFIVPKFIPDRSPAPDTAVWAEFKKEMGQVRIDTSTKNDATEHHNYKKEYAQERTQSVMPVYFRFDPNTVTEDQLKQLGLTAKTIGIITHYREKGGKFKKREDLLKIYSLPQDQANALMPYVDIATDVTVNVNHENVASNSHHEFAVAKSKTVIRDNWRLHNIDINTADTGAFVALPGIGTKLALRIIKFRDQLGGFYKIEQVAETFALPDSVFQLIKPVLQLGVVNLRKININESDVNMLKAHPYIRWAMANAIVAYRNQHGKYKSVNDLLQVQLVTPAIFEKLSPYISVDGN